MTQDRLLKDQTKTINENVKMSSKEGLLLGLNKITLESMYWNPSQKDLFRNPHLLIVGDSGSGKSYFIQSLALELVRKKFSMIVIDYNGDFLPKSIHPDLKRNIKVVEYNAEKGINLNPLSIQPGDSKGPINVAVRLSAAFSRVYNLGIQQKSLLRDTCIELLDDHGIISKHKESWTNPPPDLQDLYESLKRISEKKQDTRKNLAQSLKSHISDLFIFDTFKSNGISISWPELMDNPGLHIIQLTGLKGIDLIMTELLLWDFYHVLFARGPSKFSGALVLDEVHKLTVDEDSPINSLVREGRKFGVSMIFATQSPNDLSDVFWSNMEAKLLFKVSVPPTSRSLLNGVFERYGVDEFLRNLYSRLGIGESLFLTSQFPPQCLSITSIEKRIKEQ